MYKERRKRLKEGALSGSFLTKLKLEKRGVEKKTSCVSGSVKKTVYTQTKKKKKKNCCFLQRKRTQNL